MGKEFYVVLLLSLCFVLLVSTGCQDSRRFAVSGKGGTLGFGGELTAGLATDINARVGVNGLDFDFDDQEIEDVTYKVGVDLSSVSALVDWYIFDDPFHLTGGFINMNNKINLDARPTNSVEIGDNTYTPAEIGTLTGKAEIDGLSPYLGIGWGNPMQSNRRWGFTMDLGVAFTDSPDVSLSATGMAAGLPEDIEIERRKIEDDLDFIRIYPVFSLGLFIRF